MNPAQTAAEKIADAIAAGKDHVNFLVGEREIRVPVEDARRLARELQEKAALEETSG